MHCYLFENNEKRWGVIVTSGMQRSATVGDSYLCNHSLLLLIRCSFFKFLSCSSLYLSVYIFSFIPQCGLNHFCTVTHCGFSLQVVCLLSNRSLLQRSEKTGAAAIRLYDKELQQRCRIHTVYIYIERFDVYLLASQLTLFIQTLLFSEERKPKQ